MEELMVDGMTVLKLVLKRTTVGCELDCCGLGEGRLDLFCWQGTEILVPLNTPPPTNSRKFLFV
jgi:hypothetical protein